MPNFDSTCIVAECFLSGISGLSEAIEMGKFIIVCFSPIQQFFQNICYRGKKVNTNTTMPQKTATTPKKTTPINSEKYHHAETMLTPYFLISSSGCITVNRQKFYLMYSSYYGGNALRGNYHQTKEYHHHTLRKVPPRIKNVTTMIFNAFQAYVLSNPLGILPSCIPFFGGKILRENYHQAKENHHYRLRKVPPCP